MIREKFGAYFQSAQEFLKKNGALLFSILTLLVVTGTTFSLQSRNLGWEPGYDELQPKHHGWVSSQGLAIISTATLENRFVGYAVEFVDEQGKLQYDYFDRYPVFYSALFNRVLALRPRLASKVYLARQVMNFIYLATLVVAFLLIDKLIRHKLLSLAAVLFTFSNPFLLFYKDMVHFDQPALFGYLLLIYAIALYKIDGLRLPVWLVTFVAIALGRGYASYSVLILWFAIESFQTLRSRALDLKRKITAIARHPSFLLLVIAILWGAALLSYNVMVEAQKRDIAILETSILDSAQRRLALSDDFNQEYEHIIHWGGFLQSLVNRIIQWSFPVDRVNLGIIGNALLLCLMFALTWLVAHKHSREKRILYILLALSGFIWLLPLRNLAAFHDYTTMYFIGIPLVFFSSGLLLLKPSKDAAYYLAIMGLIVYLSGLTQVKSLHESISGNGSEYTYDFSQIVEKIEGTGNNIHLVGDIPYGPYAPRFYLSEQHLSPLELADYVIASDENYLPNNLTPGNRVMFLFKKP